MDIQPVLQTDSMILYPLEEADFEALYAAASDPLIWEQHPNKHRWQREVFTGFFEGAMQSKGAFKIVDKQTGKIAGSTRYYDYNEQTDSIFIGYTFYQTAYWGKGINRAVKDLMLEYAFRFVSKVYFHVGAQNLRSQIAMERIGGKKIKEEEIAYVGEAPRQNFLYAIGREEWITLNQKR